MLFTVRLYCDGSLCCKTKQNLICKLIRKGHTRLTGGNLGKDSINSVEPNIIGKLKITQ